MSAGAILLCGFSLWIGIFIGIAVTWFANRRLDRASKEIQSSPKSLITNTQICVETNAVFLCPWCGEYFANEAQHDTWKCLQQRADFRKEEL